MIELKNVSKKFDEKKVIDNINISFYAGQITFIVGASGAGKTTLLNIIGGLSKCSSGNILFNGCNIGKDLNTYRAKNVGFIFQDYNLISGMSIVDNVLVGTEIAGVEIKEDEIISEVKKLGISDPYQKVETLSGGEKQRVAVIRSICKNADILIADEPTGNLDSKNAYQVLDMLQSMKEEKHIIIVSHDIEKARKYGDRIITLCDGKIVSDEMITSHNLLEQRNEREELIRNKKNTLLNTIYKLGKNSVIIRKGKIISIALVIAMLISSVASVIYLNYEGDNISHDVNINYLENDLINLYYGNTPNTGYMEYPFGNEDICEIENTYDIKEKVLLYRYPTNEWLFSVDMKCADVCIKQININDFFYDRVFSNDIEGRFIEKKNEIILAEDVAQELFVGDCIGETVILNDGRGSSIEYTIVGINHTKNPLDEIYSFVSSDSLKDMLETSLENSIFGRQELMDYQTEVQTMITGGLYGSMQKIDKSEKVIYGDYSDTKEEIMVSSQLLMQIYRDMGIETNYTYDQIVEEQIEQEDICKIFEKKYALNFNGVFPIYISGVYVSENIELRFSDNLIRDMKIADPVSIDIYIADFERVSQIKDSINEKYDFEAMTQLETLKGNVSMQTRFFTIALVLIGIVLVCLSWALLSSYAKISVLERKKEVAIIKCLGANNTMVMKVLIFDSVVISILALLMSIVFFGITKLVMLQIVANGKIILAGFPLELIIMIGLLSMILIFIQTGLKLRKLVKQMPADLLVI